MLNDLELSVEKGSRMNATRNLVKALINEFVEASTLIGTLDDYIYRLDSDKKRSIGAHFRHNYDLVNNCLVGLRSGKVDYARRERDPLMEQNRAHAIERMAMLRNNLEALPDELLDGPVQVRSEIDNAIWHYSSGLREIEFLLSHTVHHHAMIAEKLRGSDSFVPDNFGVAPSTLEFWAAKSGSAK